MVKNSIYALLTATISSVCAATTTFTPQPYSQTTITPSPQSNSLNSYAGISSSSVGSQVIDPTSLSQGPVIISGMPEKNLYGEQPSLGQTDLYQQPQYIQPIGQVNMQSYGMAPLTDAGLTQNYASSMPVQQNPTPINEADINPQLNSSYFNSSSMGSNDPSMASIQSNAMIGTNPFTSPTYESAQMSPPPLIGPMDPNSTVAMPMNANNPSLMGNAYDAMGMMEAPMGISDPSMMNAQPNPATAPDQVSLQSYGSAQADYQPMNNNTPQNYPAPMPLENSMTTDGQDMGDALAGYPQSQFPIDGSESNDLDEGSDNIDGDNINEEGAMVNS